MRIVRQYARLAFAACVLSTALAMQSCADKEKNVTDEDFSNNPKLIVNVVGISAEEGVATKMKNKSRPISQSKNEFIDLGDMKADVSVGELAQEYQGQAFLKRAGTTAQVGDSKTQSMQKDCKYRLVLYKKDGSFASSTMLSAGTATAIAVENGEEYSWFAYSLNSTESVAELDNEDNPKIPTAVDKDVLYTSGTGLTTGTQNTNLAITFKHLVSKITVAVDVRGLDAAVTLVNPLPAKINSLSAVFENSVDLPQAIVNLRTGALEGLKSHSIPGNTAINFHESELLGNAVREANFYTAKNDGTNIPLQVKINSMSVSYDNKTENLSALRANFSTVYPAPGKDILAGIKLFKSSGTLGDVVWAPGRLWYDVNGGDNKYKFRPNDTERYDERQLVDSDWWPFMAATPIAYKNIGQSDPCVLVIPLNSWRMPTEAEMLKVVNTTPANAELVGYVKYTTTEGKAIQFNMDGFMKMVSKDNNYVADFDGWNGFVYNMEGKYWTSNSIQKDILYGKSFSYSKYWGYPVEITEERAIPSTNNTFVKANIRCVKN